jgi:CheY-like chemotaxis protein
MSPASAPSNNANVAERSRPLVLVVDDDLDLRESVREALADAGYETACAQNGDEALAYLQRSRTPAAILLDLFMPVMNGWEFVRRLRGTRFEAIPVIVVTSSGPHWGPPVARVLRKPIDFDGLLAEVRAATAPSSGHA